MLDFVTLVQLVLSLVAGLVGLPALVSVIATALEYYNLLSAENTDTFIFWANAVTFIGVFVLAFMGKLDLINQIDITFGQIANILSYVLILLGIPMSFAISKATHSQIRSARFLGLRGVG